MDGFNLKPTPPALATDTQDPLTDGEPHALLDDFDSVGHAPDSGQVCGIARVTPYALILLQYANELSAVDRVRRLLHWLNVRQRSARWTHVARPFRRLSGIDHVTVFHSLGAQEPNKVRNPKVCYAEVNDGSEKDDDHPLPSRRSASGRRCLVLTIPLPMARPSIPERLDAMKIGRWYRISGDHRGVARGRCVLPGCSVSRRLTAAATRLRYVRYDPVDNDYLILKGNCELGPRVVLWGHSGDDVDRDGARVTAWTRLQMPGPDRVTPGTGGTRSAGSVSQAGV